MKKVSNFLQINANDLIKGFLMAFISAILTGVYTGLSSVPPTIPITWAQWQPIVFVGLGAGISYILKNWLTNSKDQFLKKEPDTIPPTS